VKNKLSVLVVGLVAMVASGGCSSVTPGPGQEAVLVYKPWLFGSGGVDATPIKTGRTYVALSTDSVIVDVQPQQFSAHFEDLMSSDGVPLDFDGVIRLQVTDSVRLVKDFGPKWYENNVEKEFANRVRQAVRKHGMNETAIDTKAIDSIDKEVSEAMEEYIKKANLPLRLVDMTVGKANPPDAIKTQRVETAAQQQRQLTEIQRKLAEDQRKMAEESRAKADNAYREAMQLSPDQFLKLETIKMQKVACGPDGKATCTFFIGGSGPTPVVNTK
jgi:regulator of protease activity HflC (stomatin/prohibitin superfamily)